MNKINATDLEKALENSWSKFTSADPFKWSTDNKAYGQCAVTAIIVQDYLGGEIVWASAVCPNGNATSHYFNKIDGIEIDLTRKQFPENVYIPEGVPKVGNFKTTRDYVLSYPPTESRYRTLKRNVEEYIANSDA